MATTAALDSKGGRLPFFASFAIVSHVVVTPFQHTERERIVNIVHVPVRNEVMRSSATHMCKGPIACRVFA